MAINAHADEIHADVGREKTAVISNKSWLRGDFFVFKNLDNHCLSSIMESIFHHGSSAIELLKAVSIGIFLSVFISLLIGFERTFETQAINLVVGMIFGCVIAMIVIKKRKS